MLHPIQLVQQLKNHFGCTGEGCIREQHGCDIIRLLVVIDHDAVYGIIGQAFSQLVADAIDAVEI
jgi:hypothetical protein